ncbi:MAG: hypothetical protein WC107_05770 [Patescibacteria group bacterium]|jgi:hypothetical protein
MNETLREIYKTKSFWEILDAIESRLSTLESRSKLANCVDVEEFYKDDTTLEQSASQPATTGEGWHQGNEPIWLAFVPYGKEEYIVREATCGEVANNDLWQPIIPGGSKPLPPEEVK